MNPDSRLRRKGHGTTRPKLCRAIITLLCLYALPASHAEIVEIWPQNADEHCDEEFEAAANALAPGDELVLHAGVYSQSCVRSISVRGRPGEPVVIRAAPGARVLMTRPADNLSTQNNLEIVASTHLTIRGIAFGGGSIGVRFMGGSDIVFEDNEVYGTGATAITLNRADHQRITLRRNEIHHSGLDTSASTTGEGIYAGCNDGACRVTDSVFRGNHIHHLRATADGGNDGIEIKPGSGGNIVSGNYVHHTDIGRRFPCVFVYGGGEKRNVVENNVLHDCDEGIQVAADAIVRNNVIYATARRGIAAGPHAQVPDAANVTISANTVIGRTVCVDLDWRRARNVLLSSNAFICPGGVAVTGTVPASTVMLENVYAGTTRFTSAGLLRLDASNVARRGATARMRRAEAAGYRWLLNAANGRADMNADGVTDGNDLELLKGRLLWE